MKTSHEKKGLPGRRSFLSAGISAGVSGAILSTSVAASAQQNAYLNPGDAAILRFLGALEIIETDLWIQYAELGGSQPDKGNKDPEVRGLTGGNPLYTDALTLLDGDMPQYIHDNTDDE